MFIVQHWDELKRKYGLGFPLGEAARDYGQRFGTSPFSAQVSCAGSRRMVKSTGQIEPNDGKTVTFGPIDCYIVGSGVGRDALPALLLRWATLPGSSSFPGSTFFPCHGLTALAQAGGLTAEADLTIFTSAEKESSMAAVSKNARTSSATQRFYCPCGGEVKMKTLFENGKVKNLAECEKCKRTERRPRDFV